MKRVSSLALGLLFATAGSTAGQAATANPHGGLPDGLVCTACHTSEAWSPLRADLRFDHASTGFALDGRHEDVSCASCHEGLRYDDDEAEQSDCASCHLDVHLGTPTRPCSACHTTESFNELPAGIVHPADFPLEGAHLQASCESCHTHDLGGAFSPPGRECTSCHMGDYLSSLLVDHQSLGFSTYCVDCHSTLSFRDVAFDHFTMSGGFELRGAHRGIECTTCHSLPNGGVPFTPSGAQDCISCHLAGYQGQHGGTGYPTDCLMCHNENTWAGAHFDHLLATGFELIPNHDRLPCVACHVGSTTQTIFSPTGPQDCIACHQADYDQQHTGTGFSTNCLSCHHSTTWAGAMFNHPIPINSGAHVVAKCADCHTVPNNYTQFTCTSACHHTAARTNPQHTSVNGYSYDSAACLSCHPNGRR